MSDTDRLRLHSGAPFWLLDAGLEEFDAPIGSCDVAIVGAGITGAMLADRLTAAGLKVVLFDRRVPAYGSTAASTALLQYDLDFELGALSEMMPKADAVRAYHVSAAAVESIGALCADLDDGCGFTRRSSLYLASSRSDGRRLRTEHEARADAGLDAEFWSAREVRDRYGFPSHGALRTNVAAEVDPVRLTRALLRRAIGRGAGLAIRTAVDRVDRDGHGLRVEARRGTRRISVHAGRVIYATGYEMPASMHSKLVNLNSTFALVTEPLEDFGAWDDRCLVWETARPYTYMRTTGDGRILIGGADLPFKDPDWRDRMLPGRVRKLERRLRRLLPRSPCITAFSWAGTFAETKDGLPLIGSLAYEPLVSYALGYGGNGITSSMIAADLIHDQCRGIVNDDARLFRLDRAAP